MFIILYEYEELQSVLIFFHSILFDKTNDRCNTTGY